MENNGIPKQKISASKKTTKWAENCVKAFIDLKDKYAYNISGRRSEIKKLYDFYNGHIDKIDYNYVLKPYGKSRSNFPSKLRNYPIIKPVVDLLLGEKSKRPLNYSVIVTNSDSVDIREEEKKQQIMQVLHQKFIVKMQAQGQMQGVDVPPPEEIPLPEHIVKEFDQSYVDIRANKGQSSLNYILQEQEISDKFNKGWFHFLVTGEVYTHRGVRNDEPFYEILNPMDVDYDLDPDLEFVEDGDWASIRKYAHASTIIDHFHDELTPEQVARLEDPIMYQDNQLYISERTQNPNGNETRLIEVITVYWKSRKKLGFLTFLDPMTGELEEMMVEDGFKMPPELKEIGAVLEWKWLNEVWEGTKIGGDTGGNEMYLQLRPIPNQRDSMDNPSKCKLPINGRRYSDYNSKNISLVSLGIPYQLNYNIFKYRLEVAIAKSKDIIAQFDINMIPKKWDMDKFMYYVDATGIAWVDYNKEGITLSPQHQSVLDMSIKTIEQYIVLLESIVLEWERISGVNRQRQGEVGQYEGKATSQQAIMQSSHITEDLFRKFGRLEQRDLQAMIDYSKQAWINGKKTMYVMPDGTPEFLSMDPTSHLESNYGVFVSDAGMDLDKKLKIESLAQSMIQNGTPASIVAEAIDAESFIKIKDKIKKAEDHMEQLAQQQQQAQQQMQEQAMQMEQQKMENENMNKERDRQVEIEKALISADASDNTDIDIRKIEQTAETKEKEIQVKSKDQEEEVRSNMAQENLEKQKIANDRRKINVDSRKNNDSPKSK